MAKKSKAQKKSGGNGKARASAELKAVIDDLVLGNRILYVQDVVDSYGHISARHPHRHDRFLMSRPRAPGLAIASDIMDFGPDAVLTSAAPRPVYSHRFIHYDGHLARLDATPLV